MKNLVISITNSIKQSISKLEKNREKCLLVVNNNEKLVGTLTDGDIRRAMLRGANIDSQIGRYIKKKPVVLQEREISQSVSTRDKNNKIKILLNKLKDNDGIDLIPIVDKNKRIKKVLFKKDFGKYLEKKKLLFSVPAVIMAGGEGKRLKEFSNYFPKPLLPFENSTAIEYIIGNFSKFNVKKFYISVNYKKNLIKSYLKENNYKNISYMEEKNARGTVGSLSMLKNKIKQDFFLINCDTILGINFEKFYEYHKKNKFDLTLVAASKNFKLSYGSCEVKKNGQLNKINEKPNLNYLVNVGLYLMKPDIIKMIPNKGTYDIDELIKKLKTKRKKIGVFPISENSWIDTGFLRNKEINL